MQAQRTARRPTPIHIESATKKHRSRRAQTSTIAREQKAAVHAKHVERTITCLLKAPMPTTNDDEWLRYREAASLLSVTPGTLTVWVCNGRYALPYYKIGRNVLFKRSELLAWLATRRRGGNQFVSRVDPDGLDAKG